MRHGGLRLRTAAHHTLHMPRALVFQVAVMLGALRSIDSGDIPLHVTAAGARACTHALCACYIVINRAFAV